jgi:hypothetical protein
VLLLAVSHLWVGRWVAVVTRPGDPADVYYKVPPTALAGSNQTNLF